MARTDETAEQQAHREACELVKLRYQEAMKAVAQKVRHESPLTESERHWVVWLIEGAEAQVGSNWFLLTSLTSPEP